MRAAQLFSSLVMVLTLCHCSEAVPAELFGVWNGTFASDNGFQGAIANWTIHPDGSCQAKWEVYRGPVDMGISSGTYTFVDGRLQFSLLGSATGFGSRSQYKLTGSGTMEGFSFSGDYNIAFYNLVWRTYGYASDTGTWQLGRDEFAEPDIRIVPAAISVDCSDDPNDTIPTPTVWMLPSQSHTAPETLTTTAALILGTLLCWPNSGWAMNRCSISHRRREAMAPSTCLISLS